LIDDYKNALKLGEKEAKRYRNSGHYPYPSSLEFLVPELSGLSREPVGTLEVPMELVVGTLSDSRQNLFSKSFYPLADPHSEFAAKWNNLYESQVAEGIRDPIKVYEFLHRFYVIEGNKRVSVLRYLNSPTITCDITRVVPRDLEGEEKERYQAFVRFMRVCPLYEIDFSKGEYYEKLASLLGQTLDEPWSVDAVKTLRAAIQRFSLFYSRKDGLDLGLSRSDAFLVYIFYFPLESLLNDSDETLTRRFGRIRRELKTESNQDHIAYVESSLPEDSVGDLEKLLSRLPAKTRAKLPIKVAFIHDLSAETSARVHSHELGRKWLEQTYEGVIKTYAFEDRLSVFQFDRAIEAALAEGCSMIFTTSPALLPRTMVAALQHPEIHFLNCSINLSHEAVRCYDGKMFECKFLMGALAASFAENHKIGYLAGTPVYGTIANINAFAIGAQMVDPYAKIYLNWTSQKDADWYQLFYDAGISVLSDSDFIAAKDKGKGRPYGVYKLLPDGGTEKLALPVWNWGKYYEYIIRTVLSGSYNAHTMAGADQALNYWLGLESGAIDIETAPTLPYASLKLVEGMRRSIIAGTLQPFDGELHRQDGSLVKGPDDPVLTVREILTMDWLNDNIIGQIPSEEELDAVSKSMTAVTGVAKKQPEPSGEEVTPDLPLPDKEGQEEAAKIVASAASVDTKEPAVETDVSSEESPSSDDSREGGDE